MHTPIFSLIGMLWLCFAPLAFAPDPVEPELLEPERPLAKALESGNANEAHRVIDDLVGRSGTKIGRPEMLQAVLLRFSQRRSIPNQSILLNYVLLHESDFDRPTYLPGMLQSYTRALRDMAAGPLERNQEQQTRALNLANRIEELVLRTAPTSEAYVSQLETVLARTHNNPLASTGALRELLTHYDQLDFQKKFNESPRNLLLIVMRGLRMHSAAESGLLNRLEEVLREFPDQPGNRRPLVDQAKHAVEDLSALRRSFVTKYVESGLSLAEAEEKAARLFEATYRALLPYCEGCDPIRLGPVRRAWRFCIAAFGQMGRAVRGMNQ